MAFEDKSDGRSVQLKGIRLSFTDRIHEADKTSEESDKLTHGCNFILESTSPHFAANKAKIEAALRIAGEKTWKNPDAYLQIQEDNPKRVTFRKGERFKNKEGKIYAGYEGNYAFAANGPGGGLKRPKLLDRRKGILREQASREQLEAGKVFEVAKIPDIFYGGVIADAIVSFYGTDKGSRGMFATVEAIRSHEEGERMGGGGIYVDEDDFDDIEDDDSFGSGPATTSAPAAGDFDLI
jgi:hypothetical protein